MRVSASMDLVMQLAAREAIAGSFGEIRSEHVFNALLKCAELPENQICAIASDHEVRETLTADIATLRDELDGLSIDSTAARRTVRMKLGKGEAAFKGGELHRTPECRRIFDLSARLAEKHGEDVLSPAHLLEALLFDPPGLIRDVLEGIRRVEARRSRTPVLDEHALNISSQNSEGISLNISGRKGELKALAHALVDEKRYCVLAISAREGLTQELVRAVFQNAGEADSPKPLRTMRMMFPHSAPATFHDAMLAREIASELVKDGKTMLFFSLRETGEKNSGWFSNVQNMITQDSIRCVFDITQQVYKELFHAHQPWTRIAHVMTLPDEAAQIIPNEI